MIATLLAAKRGGGLELAVGANDTGHTRPLNEPEQRELAERDHELRARRLSVSDSPGDTRVRGSRFD